MPSTELFVINVFDCTRNFTYIIEPIVEMEKVIAQRKFKSWNTSLKTTNNKKMLKVISRNFFSFNHFSWNWNVLASSTKSSAWLSTSPAMRLPIHWRIHWSLSTIWRRKYERLQRWEDSKSVTDYVTYCITDCDSSIPLWFLSLFKPSVSSNIFSVS